MTCYYQQANFSSALFWDIIKGVSVPQVVAGSDFCFVVNGSYYVNGVPNCISSWSHGRGGGGGGGSGPVSKISSANIDKATIKPVYKISHSQIMNSTAKTVIALLIGLGIGAVVGGTYSYQKGYTQARVDIKTSLEERGFIHPAALSKQSVSGRVVSIAGNTLQLAVPPPFDPTTATPLAPTVYTVSVDGRSAILSRTLNTKVLPKRGQPFDPFVVTKITFANIAVGDTLIADAGQTIASTSFYAASLTVIKF